MKKKIESFLESKKCEYILLSLILLLGFFIRLYKIDNPIADWHSWRQADTASVTRNYIQNGVNLLVPKFDDISSIQSRILNLEGYRMVEFPVYNAISAYAYKSFPKLSLEIWSRLITIFCALTSALLLYLIGKRFMGRIGGLLTAFFYLFIPFNIYFTRVILPDPMGVTFGLAGIWFFIKFIDDKGWVYFYLSGIFFALMMLIKPYLGFYLVPVVYLTIRKYGYRKTLVDKKLTLVQILDPYNYRKIMFERKILISEILFLLIIVLPFVIWRWWESQFPAGIPLFWWAFNGSGIRFRPAYWNWVFGERLGHLILGSFGLIPFTFGVLNNKNKNNFIQWFLIGVVFYVILVATANVMHDYYQILTIPAISLALASGSVYLWNLDFTNKILSRSILIFSIFIMLVTGWYQVKGNYVINHWEIIEAGSEIDKITPKDAVVVAPYNGDTAFLYQTKRRGWPAVDNSIDNIIKEGADYYVSVDLNSSDTINFEKRFYTVIKNDKYVILDLHKELKQ